MHALRSGKPDISHRPHPWMYRKRIKIKKGNIPNMNTKKLKIFLKIFPEYAVEVSKIVLSSVSL
jgi:hypothetical protein